MRHGNILQKSAQLIGFHSAPGSSQIFAFSQQTVFVPSTKPAFMMVTDHDTDVKL